MTLDTAPRPDDDPALLATAVAADDRHWYRDAVIYQLNVKAFCDSNGDGVGDFKGVTAKLDYVCELGVNTIWLMPFYPSPLRDDGYDIAHYEDVHPQYGTLADFREMLDAAHQRGLRVVTELVINHTSDAHPWFQAARQALPGSPARDFYVWSDTDALYAGTRIIFTDTETSNWTWDPVAKAFFWHRFFSHQPDLNYDNPAVLEAVFKTMRFWLDMGVDGFRLDAVPYLVERDGTRNENLPETHAVIRQLRAAIDAHYPNRLLLAEANMWPEDVREYFGNGDECHMAYHFPLMPRMYMAIAQEERDPIVEIMAQTPEIPDGCQWAIFLRNHDELTLEMVTSKERDYMYRMYAADPRARINLGIRRRLAPLMDNDLDRIKLMNSLLLSMPGSPIIYYGDEIGMGDDVRIGDRNGVRTPMQWSAARNAGFSHAETQQLYLQPITDPVYGYQARNVEAQATQAGSLLNWTRRMLAVRKTSAAFGRSRRQFLRPGNRKVLAYTSAHGGEVLLFVANLARSAQPVELDLHGYKGRVPVELLGRTAFAAIGDAPYALTIAAHGFYWFRLATDVAAPRWHQGVAPIDDRPVLVLFDGWTSLFPDRVMPWRIGMAERIRAQFETETLPRHILAQRWYAGRSAGAADGPRRARLLDHAVWPQGGTNWLLLQVALDRSADGVRYFQPLALAWEDDDEDRMKCLAVGGVAKVRQQARVGVLGDAFHDDAFCRALVLAIGRDTRCATSSGTLHFQPAPAFATLCTPAELASITITRPQAHSHSPVVHIGERLLLKGYHRLRSGLHPELEIGRFLSEVVHFPHCAAVAGALAHVAADGGVTTLALLQAQVPNQGDGQANTAAYLDRHLEEWRANPRGVPADVHGAYLTLVQTLGQRSAQLHQALGTPTGRPAFDPEPTTPAHRAADLAAVQAAAQHTLDLLALRQPGMTADLRSPARSLLAQRETLRRRLQVAASGAGQLRQTRLHGEYGLAQVLLSRNDFIIIGFGGSAAAPLAAGRTKGMPLRDVAGMLQSFTRARLQALQRLGPPGSTGPLQRLARSWETQARQTFLAAYDAAMIETTAAADTTTHAAQPHAGGWLWLFEVDTALAQLQAMLQQPADNPHPPLLALAELLARPDPSARPE